MFFFFFFFFLDCSPTLSPPPDCAPGETLQRENLPLSVQCRGHCIGSIFTGIYTVSTCSTIHYSEGRTHKPMNKPTNIQLLNCLTVLMPAGMQGSNKGPPLMSLLGQLLNGTPVVVQALPLQLNTNNGHRHSCLFTLCVS